jgi:uncharacterized membrane protein HdeD (DUF308 family)
MNPEKAMNATATTTTNAGSIATHMDHSAWMWMLRGAIAILFGVLALAMPGLTLLLLVGLFAAYALLSGAVSIAAAVRGRSVDTRWWLLLLLGLVSIAAGIGAIAYPGLTALFLVLLMGANALVTGVLDIALAVRLRSAHRGTWLLVLCGIVSIVFGVFVFAFPGAGALALVWLISLYAVVTGALLLALGLQARRAAHAGGVHPAVPAGRR